MAGVRPQLKVDGGLLVMWCLNGGIKIDRGHLTIKKKPTPVQIIQVNNLSPFYLNEAKNT